MDNLQQLLKVPKIYWTNLWQTKILMAMMIQMIGVTQLQIKHQNVDLDHVPMPIIKASAPQETPVA